MMLTRFSTDTMFNLLSAFFGIQDTNRELKFDLDYEVSENNHLNRISSMMHDTMIKIANIEVFEQYINNFLDLLIFPLYMRMSFVGADYSSTSFQVKVERNYGAFYSSKLKPSSNASKKLWWSFLVPVINSFQSIFYGNVAKNKTVLPSKSPRLYRGSALD